MADLSPVSTGTYLQALEAIRDALVADLTMCESMRDKAALYNRLELTLRLIEDVKPKEPEGDGIDEIAQRRATRRSSPASGSARAKRSG